MHESDHLPAHLGMPLAGPPADACPLATSRVVATSIVVFQNEPGPSRLRTKAEEPVDVLRTRDIPAD